MSSQKPIDEYFSFDYALKPSQTSLSLNNTDSNVKNETQTKYLLTHVYSGKKYARWFDVSETKIHDSGDYTIYKIIYRLIPNDINENIKELFVWKRFRELKDLYEALKLFHSSLHRRGKFPEFVQTNYFGRFNKDTIIKRKKCILNIFKFCASEIYLINHEKFIEFFSDSVIEDLKIRDDTLVPIQVSSIEENLFEPKVIFKKTNDSVSLKSQLEEAIDEEKEINEEEESKFINQNNDLHELNHGNKYIYLKLENNCLIIKSKNEDNLFYLKFKRKSSESKIIQLNYKNYFKYMTNLFTYYQNEYSIFLLLDYKKNGRLYDYCKYLGDKLSLYQLKLYLAQILCALEELHSMNITCKDLKMDNILVDDNKNRICLTYFCNHVLIDQNIDQEAIEFKYTAPEVNQIFSDNEITSNCDLWSYGVIFFDLLAIKSGKRFKEVYSSECDYNVFLNNDQATKLISQLIQTNPTDRLPINKIKDHDFFKDINWDNMQ